MKAVTITKHGGVDGLDVLEVNDPPLPTADRVRVRVRAAGLNRADVLQRQGHYPAPPGYSQNIPGLEFAGEVEEVGAEAHLWKRGQRVFGITGGGAQAEGVLVDGVELAVRGAFVSVRIQKIDVRENCVLVLQASRGKDRNRPWPWLIQIRSGELKSLQT